MNTLYKDNSLTIGKTPLVKLNKMTSADVYVKIEARNPATSVKCRIGANMIWDAERRGALKPGMTVLEPTSGNTGIALAFVCASRGYRLVLTMPETMSLERRQLIKALGAELILTPGEKGMPGAISAAKDLYEKDPENTFLPQQFDNPANPEIHEKTTGPEIWEATEGMVDIFVAGVGTGGTITGTSRFLKAQKEDIQSIAVEPEASPIITQSLRGIPLTPGLHKIQGIGAGFLPSILDLSLINGTELVTNEEAIQTAHRLMREEGILAGISSGAAAAAAIRIAERKENQNKMVVAILPDSGERYLSSILFADTFTDKELVQ